MDTEELFNCQRCGFCCQGETTVSLDEDDQQRMKKALGLSNEAIVSQYWRITGNCVQMKTVNGHCIFYDEGCIVHKGRPWRCGQWPLHPSILDDETNYWIIAESCPGINTQLGYEEFCRILRGKMAEKEKIRC